LKVVAQKSWRKTRENSKLLKKMWQRHCFHFLTLFYPSFRLNCTPHTVLCARAANFPLQKVGISRTLSRRRLENPLFLLWLRGLNEARNKEVVFMYSNWAWH
jgi:hypothetical protein